MLSALLLMSAVEVSPRTQAVLLLVTPKASAIRASTSDYLLAADAVAQQKTGLEILSVEQAGVDQLEMDRCGSAERLLCWTQQLRPGGRKGPRYLLVLAVHPAQPGEEQLVTMMIDTHRALALQAKTPRTSGWRERVENALFEEALKTSARSIKSGDARALKAYFEELFGSRFRSALEREGLWRPFGQVALLTPPSGAVIELDGRRVGLVEGARAELQAIQPGAHTITLRTADGRAASTQIQLERGQRLELPASAFAFPAPGAHPARLAAQWGGAAIAVSGVALAIYGLTLSLDNVNAACISRDGGDCAGLGQPSFGYDGAQAPALRPDAVNPGGVLVGGLGLSLMSAGLSWSLGAWLWGERTEVPWVPLALGLALGGATYGIAAAVDGR